MSEVPIAQIAGNLAAVKRRIAEACVRAGREPESVRLVPVTKQRPIEQVHELYRLGEREFAENRAQEARDRIPAFGHPATWHFIGPIQTNKAKYLPGRFAWVHSVDRIDAAEALQKAMQKHPELPPLKVLLQVNIAGEEQKHGTQSEESETLLRGILDLDRLDLQGMMCMAPYSDNPEDSRQVFRGLRLLRDELAGRTGRPLPHLSMGMTGDFEVAIEEGATIVRVGTALFE
jgi:pyridoxal phosphate enzyme (YggS family)